MGPERCRPTWPLAALLLFLSAGPGEGLGKPEWARPYLGLPSPAGEFIAAADTWVVVYGEIVLGLRAERFIEVRQRLVLENRSDRPETFTMTLAYDQSQNELADLSLHVQRAIWREINLDRRAVKASAAQQAQLLLASVEAIEPRRRVVLEYTLVDRLDVTPWAEIRIPRSEPVAQMVVRLDPTAASQGLQLHLFAPEGSDPPPGFVRGEDGSWTVSAVPAAARLTTSRLLFQPAESDLFPVFLAWRRGSPAEDPGAFAAFYRRLWQSRLAEVDAAQVRRTAEELTAGATTPLEKARRLAHFVQHEVRYDDSNSASIDAWLPLGTQETLRSRKADCKGKVMLLQALFQAVGIESAPVLMRAERRYYRWAGSAAAARFNHVILAARVPTEADPLPATLLEGAGAGMVLFDPTSITVPFGTPPAGFEGMPALLIGDSPAPVFSIRTRQPAALTADLVVAMELSPRGSARVRATLLDGGLTQFSAALERGATGEEIEKATVGALSSALGHVNLREFTVETPRATGTHRPRLAFTADLPQATQTLSSSSIIPSPLAVAAALLGYPRGLRPAAPVQASEAITLSPPWNARLNTCGQWERVNIEATLLLPPGWEFALPPPRHDRFPWASVEQGWRREADGRYAATVRLEFPRGEWPGSERAARLTFTDALYSALYSPLVLKHLP